MKHHRPFEGANGSRVAEPALSQEDVVKEHVILGANQADVEKQKDLWLSENPAIKVLKVPAIRRERTLLSRLGGKNIPRFSIAVDYEEPDPAPIKAHERISSRERPPSM